MNKKLNEVSSKINCNGQEWDNNQYVFLNPIGTPFFYYIHVSEERKKKEFERVNFEEFQGKTKNAESKSTQVK